MADKKDPIQTPLTDEQRRKVLMGMAAMPAMMMPGMALAQAAQFPTAKVNTTKLAVTDTEVVVGQLHSATGTMAISETGSIQAEQLAIDQINAMGGVLGRKIRVIKEDGASDWPTFAEKSKKLLVQDKVACVFGCWTSASRKAVLPIFEKENGMLYYPTFYEGLEQSKNVIYTGQEATQQILYGLDWAAKEKSAKTFFLVGSDYIWPRTSMKIARKHIESVAKLGKVAGEEYYPLGHTNFNSLINKIKLAKPDCIFAAVVGGSNVAFYKQLKAAGITADKQFLLTISVTEDEVLGIGGENIAGFYSSMKYFQSLDNANNKAFVEAFKKAYGPKSVIGDVTQAGYLGPWIWKATVEKAGSFDVDKIAAASGGIELKTAPEGYVKVHDNHHLWSKARIGQAQLDGQFKVVAESPELIEPNPFPKGYQ
ncbi:periplasmic binding domain protein [Methyloversatilis sp. RAC08]|uniref:urea ABC transporter substrate-binding protein n=1 Tax=Methyloversatilis sp. RAC08 TaxID=1842540 RepID=UPI00083D5AC7|nr:urea ABC transporter substrate-binding protein [Methyloversatilis sp. RAC08]AOF83466.1 periplasmic binding domain protein [Methyloversatilis sp. RAC08]